MVGSIQCFVGDVGSGKSLRCIMEAVLAAQSGREVYLNFPLKLAEQTSEEKAKGVKPKTQLEIDFPEIAKHIHYIQDFYGFLEEREREMQSGNLFKEFEALFIVDEAQAIWNSRTSMSQLQIMSTNYIFISRHIGLELHMATQLASNIDKRAKLLVQVWVVCSKFLHNGEVYFQFEFYNPEAGEVKTTYLTPQAAEQFYGYYETTGPQSSGMMPTPLGLDEPEPSRPLSIKTFNSYKAKQNEIAKNQSHALKDLTKELKAIRKEVQKVDEATQKLHGKSLKQRKQGKQRNKGKAGKKHSKSKKKRR